MNNNERLSFDVVVATRNRSDALAISIPLFISQSRQPAKIIVIDSSEDHEVVKHVVQDAAIGWSGEVRVEHSKIVSSSYQRNVGLGYSTADVIIFPDDDSFVLPGAFESMMEVYEADGDKAIAAVCSAEAINAPEGLFDSTKTYAVSLGDRFGKSIAKYRTWLEKRIIPDPLKIHGRKLSREHQVPGWLSQENAVVVEYMTGFRMSFRSEVIKRCKFIEVFTGYCLAEDIGASFMAMEYGLVVGARNAQIYHHRYPGKRADATTYGFCQMANVAYVVAKTMKKNDVGTIASLYIRGLYKLLGYLPGLRNRYGREMFVGALVGLAATHKFFAASGDLDSVYRSEFGKL